MRANDFTGPIAIAENAAARRPALHRGLAPPQQASAGRHWR